MAASSPAAAGARMPVLFIGHGTPMNVIGDNPFAEGWRRLADELPAPRAILCVSAHWQTEGARVTAMERPRTIHDFHGFPPAMYALRYPCPGAPEVAERTRELVRGARVEPDFEWGLDHGAWCVLARMYPGAEVPALQLSLDLGRDFRGHYELARELAPLREEGVLIMGSGNIVHALAHMERSEEAQPHDWAVEFDATVAGLLDRGEHEGLIDYRRHGRAAELSVNSGEHYLPLLYAAALQEAGEPLRHVNASIHMAALSMRCVVIG